MIKTRPLTQKTVAVLSTVLAVVALPATALAAGPASPCNLAGSNPNLLFHFPRWWEFLQGDKIGGTCTPYISWPGGVWGIGLAILDILLRVAGMATVISLLVSSVMYVTSSGNPDRAGAALSRIINSLVGLAIVLVAAAAVTYVGKSIT